MSFKDCSDAGRFAADHGISAEVWGGRPYVRWTPDDTRGLVDAFGETFSLMSKVTRVSDEHNGSGWVMTRYAPDPADLPHVFAEIRPDNAVELRPARSHYHGEMSEFPYEVLEVKESMVRLGGPRWVKYRTGDPEHPERWIPCYKPTSYAMVGGGGLAGGHINRCKEKGEDNHAGVNSTVIHSHNEEAKYLFNPSPKVERVWEHSHDEERYVKNPEALAGHIAKRHREGGVVDGPHTHSDRIKDPDRNYAARIDCHPLASELLIDADTVYFSIEGCIKADALLSAVRGEGRNASVISVPSVSLWDCPELPLVVSRFLEGKTVVIVVDADGVDNPHVTNQAAMAQNMLLQYGVGRVFVCAPALGVDGKILVDAVVGKLKGVDDFLAAGYKLGDLDVSTSVAPAEVLEEAVKNLTRRASTRKALFNTLFAFSTFTGHSGQLHARMITVSKVLGVKQQTVSNHLASLVDAGIVTVHADPAKLKDGKLICKQDWRKRWDWEERPFLVLREDLRAMVLRCPLADVL